MMLPRKGQGMHLILILLLLGSPLTALADSHLDMVTTVSKEGVLIHAIVLEGFVLGEQQRFNKIFKPYHNKHLTLSDMNDILKQIQMIYEREGYKELVSITYQVVKHRLVFTASMIS